MKVKPKVKPKQAPKPKPKPNPNPKQIPDPEDQPQKEQGVGDEGEDSDDKDAEDSQMKKDTKLHGQSMTLTFCDEGRTIAFTVSDQLHLADVVEDFLTSNNVKFEKTDTGRKEADGNDTAGTDADE
jgi:hypothetical protein